MPLAIAHNVRGEIEEYGSFELTEQETSDLWELILATGIEELVAYELWSASKLCRRLRMRMGASWLLEKRLMLVSAPVPLP